MNNHKNEKLKLINCPLCGVNNFKIKYQSTLTKKDFDPKNVQSDLKNTLTNYKKHSRIVKCKSCDLVYVNPGENINKLLKGYENVIDEEYLETEKYRKILSENYLKNIKEFKNTGKMLDVGCFAGFFLEIAKKNGFDIYGIEPSIWASELAKKRKVKIISKSIEDINLPVNNFDVITFWDVIEHLHDPKTAIKKSYNSLKYDGIIALGTPDIESLVAKILGKNNPYLLRMHLIFFSKKTLKKMLEDSGFRVIKIYSYGRVFPLKYLFDRLEVNWKIYKLFKKLINSNSKIANFTIHMNLRDSFVIIAKK